MKTYLRSAAVAAAVCAALAIGACATQSPVGSLVDTVMRQANANAPVALAVNPPQVRVGETIGLQMGSAAAGYLYVYQVGTDGKSLSVVFPNAMDGANYMPGGGVAVSLPRANWRMPARGPAGVGYFLAVVAQKQQDLNKLAADVSEGRVVIDGSYGAALATLREVAP